LDRVDKHRRQEAGCQDGAGGDHGDTREPRAPDRAGTPTGIIQAGIRLGGLSASSALLVDARISGRSFKQAPPSHGSCGRAGDGGDWPGCKADKAIVPGRYMAPQRVVFHLKPQLLHLAQTPAKTRLFDWWAAAKT
jgi:hypothetical protein